VTGTGGGATTVVPFGTAGTALPKPGVDGGAIDVPMGTGVDEV